MRPGFVRKIPSSHRPWLDSVKVLNWAAGCRVCGAVYHYNTWRGAVMGINVHLNNNICGTLWGGSRHDHHR